MVALVGLLGLGACGRTVAPMEDDAASLAIAVTVQRVRIASLRDALSLPGVVIPMAAADQTVWAFESAQIVELPRNEGDAVQAGDLLVRLDVASITNELATRQLEFAEATSRVERAKADADRLASLFERGLAARNAWEASRQTLSAAEMALTQARAHLDSAKALEERTIIRARFNGIVIKRWHNPGDLVVGAETDSILRIIDPAQLQVAVQAPVAQVARITPGQTASLLSAIGTTEALTVALRMAPKNAADTTAEVRLSFAGPTSLPMETAVQVEIVLDERHDVPVIAATAIQREGLNPFVWIAGDDSMAHRRPVQLGLIVGDLAQVTSGLSPGDTVIVTGIAQLDEGTPIRVTG